ncbi:MAG: hypothetical protein GX216_11830 [Methanomicrobiales archaeon]|nr:hypothetical protein [Methanomicrobiales archaeon]
MTTKDRQVTLAVYQVRQGTSKVGYIARCLDREFNTWKVFGFLTGIQVPFIVPVKILPGFRSRCTGSTAHGSRSSCPTGCATR